MKMVANPLHTYLKNCASSIPRCVVWIVLMVFALAGAAYLTEKEVARIRAEETQILALHARLVGNHIAGCERIVEAMAHTVQRAYVDEGDFKHHHPALDYLRDYPKYNTFGISGFAKDGGTELLSGTLTGKGSLKRIDPQLHSEIVAALALDGQMSAQTSHKSDFIWVYYTSARQFVYLAPKVGIDDFQFTDDLYKKEYWTNAVPSANPSLATVITPLYEDEGGKGLMVTVSTPVVDNRKFLGVASVDIGIESLRTLLSIGKSAGDSLLISKDGGIIAKTGTTRLGERFPHDLKPLGSKPLRIDDDWWIAQPLAGGKITIVHRLNIMHTYLAALRTTSHLWVLLLSLVGLIYLLIRLRSALAQITDIAHIDPLSSLLNRRGFRNDVERTLELNTRVSAPWVVMMLDIDYFKSINDRFGHDAGDQIIIATAKVLQSTVRISDRACRWGGEEFIVFLYNTSLDDANKLAEKYRVEISALVKTPDGAPVTVSIGVAEAAPNDTLDRVVEAADRRLYLAKQAGRNRVFSQG